MIPYSEMSEEERKKLMFFRIGDKEGLTDVRNRVCRKLTKVLVDGDKDSDVSNFECIFDDTRLYGYEWTERQKGFSHFAAFVEPKGINKFLSENKKYANEIGFDPLSPNGMEVTTEVFVYSPNRFPFKELGVLLETDADIVLVTTEKILSKYH